MNATIHHLRLAPVLACRLRKTASRAILPGKPPVGWSRNNAPARAPIRSSHRAMVFAALAISLWGAKPASAQSDRGTVGEYQVKAAFLYHFTKFVEWPPAVQNSRSIEVCVLGSDPFGPALDFLLGDKTLQGKPFEVRRVGTITDAQFCQLLFVALTDQQELKSALEALSGAAVLTVGDSPHFSRAGGMIYLFVDESKVRFDINLAAAKHSQLTISSALLRLARKVESK